MAGWGFSYLGGIPAPAIPIRATAGAF